MASQPEQTTDKVTRLVPKDGNPDVDRVLSDLIIEVEEGLEIIFENKQPHTQVMTKLLVFLHTLRDQVKYKNRKDIGEGFMNFALAVLKILDQAAEQSGKTTDLEHQLFAAETALQERSEAVVRLEGLLQQAASQEHALNERQRSLVHRTFEAGQKELAQISRIVAAVEGISSSLAPAIQELLTAVPRQSAPTAEAAGSHVEKIRAEIARRKEWLGQIRATINALGDDRTAARDELDSIREAAKYAEANDATVRRAQRTVDNLTVRIDALIANEEMVKPEVRKLEGYLKAVETVASGAVSDLIDKPLPPLTVEPIADEAPAKPLQDDVNVGEPNERYNQLADIGRKCGIKPESVLVISLYECLGADVRKSLGALVKAANDVGINTAFSLPNNMAVIEIWRSDRDDAERFVQYQGGFAGGMYSRGTVELPWNIQQLLTPAEISSFTEMATRKSDK